MNFWTSLLTAGKENLSSTRFNLLTTVQTVNVLILIIAVRFLWSGKFPDSSAVAFFSFVLSIVTVLAGLKGFQNTTENAAPPAAPVPPQPPAAS